MMTKKPLKESTTSRKSASKVDPLKEWKKAYRADNHILTTLEMDWPGAKDLARNLYQYAYELGLDRSVVNEAIGQSLSAAVRVYQEALKNDLSDRDRLEHFVRALIHEATTRINGDHPPKRDLRLQLLPRKLMAARPKDNGQEN